MTSWTETENGLSRVRALRLLPVAVLAKPSPGVSVRQPNGWGLGSAGVQSKAHKFIKVLSLEDAQRSSSPLQCLDKETKAWRSEFPKATRQVSNGDQTIFLSVIA